MPRNWWLSPPPIHFMIPPDLRISLHSVSQLRSCTYVLWPLAYFRDMQGDRRAGRVPPSIPPSLLLPLLSSNLICLLTVLDPIREPVGQEKMHTLHCWSLALYPRGLSSTDYMNQQLLQMEPSPSAISHVGFCSWVTYQLQPCGVLGCKNRPHGSQHEAQTCAPRCDRG